MATLRKAAWLGLKAGNPDLTVCQNTYLPYIGQLRCWISKATNRGPTLTTFSVLSFPIRFGITR